VKIGKPVPAPGIGKLPATKWSIVYAQALAIPEGKALPIEFETRGEAMAARDAMESGAKRHGLRCLLIGTSLLIFRRDNGV